MFKKVLDPPPPPSPRRYSSLPRKILEKISSLELWQFKIHQHSPNFRKGALILCVIVYVLENQNLNLFLVK